MSTISEEKNKMIAQEILSARKYFEDLYLTNPESAQDW